MNIARTPNDATPDTSTTTPLLGYSKPEYRSPRFPHAVAALTLAAAAFLVVMALLVLFVVIGQSALAFSGWIMALCGGLYLCSLALLLYSDVPSSRNIVDPKTNLLCLFTFLLILAGPLVGGCGFGALFMFMAR